MIKKLFPEIFILYFAKKLFYDIIWKKTDGSAVGTGVFNGDVGVIADIDPSGELITLRFDERIAVYTADLLGQLDMAYAITVHKSQGSEFELVIMPISLSYKRMLYKKLIYTGITRAKKRLIIILKNITNMIR